MEHFIPIWLVAAGACGAFQELVGIGDRIKKLKQKHAADDEDSSCFGKALTAINSLLGFFNLAWFIAGVFAFCAKKLFIFIVV